MRRAGCFAARRFAAACVALACACTPTLTQTSSYPSAPTAAPSSTLATLSGAACEPRRFAFDDVAGGTVTSAELRGRLTLVLFLATYDPASQAQARLLSNLLRRHRPRINVLGVVLEPGAHRPMIEAFAAALELGYRLALADPEQLADGSAFAGLHHVPSLVLLDLDGCERWRNIGLADAATVERALGRAESHAR
ncbi:MAG: TlpA family protein disulfide reductase [Myxococcales bacterium]|nr:TlpA family protein disulfide reductase [Myxococcales bacterium]